MYQGPHRLFLEVEDLPKRFSLLDLPTLKILNTQSCNFPFFFFYINTRHIITAFSTTKHRIPLIFRTDSEVLRLPILQGSAERLRKRSKSMDAHLLDQMKGDPERFFGMIFLVGTWDCWRVWKGFISLQAAKCLKGERIHRTHFFVTWRDFIVTFLFVPISKVLWGTPMVTFPCWKRQR